MNWICEDDNYSWWYFVDQPANFCLETHVVTKMPLWTKLCQASVRCSLWQASMFLPIEGNQSFIILTSYNSSSVGIFPIILSRFITSPIVWFVNFWKGYSWESLLHSSFLKGSHFSKTQELDCLEIFYFTFQDISCADLLKEKTYCLR